MAARRRLRTSRAQLQPQATRRRQSAAAVPGRSPFVSGRGGAWAWLRAQAGRGRVCTLELERRDPGALHWSARPPVRAVGGTWAGLSAGAGPCKAHLCGSSGGSGAAGPRGRKTRGQEPGPGSSIGGPDGASQLQVDLGVGRGTGSVRSGVRRAPLRLCPSDAGGRAGDVYVGEGEPHPLPCTPPHSGKGPYRASVARPGRVRGSGLEGKTAPQSWVWQDCPTARA